MNCQVCKVLILFLITFNSLNSARGFVKQDKNTVDVFGGSYDHDYDQDYSGGFLFTTSKTDRHLLRQKVRQRISVMKTNTLYVSREMAF